MGLLRRAGLAATLLASCYSPDVRDCTVSCAAESECAHGQVCGSDHLCARPAAAGSCLSRIGDAGVVLGDAGDHEPPHDASSQPPHDGGNQPPRPDAAPSAVALHIQIAGHGRVTVAGVGSCDSAAPDNGSCTIDVPAGVAAMLEALAYPDWMFDSWTTAPCAVNQGNICTFTPAAPTLIGVKFRKDN